MWLDTDEGRGEERLPKQTDITGVGGLGILGAAVDFLDQLGQELREVGLQGLVLQQQLLEWPVLVPYCLPWESFLHLCTVAEQRACPLCESHHRKQVQERIHPHKKKGLV